MGKLSPVQLTLQRERSRHDCAVAKNSNTDRISALCFTACLRTGVLRSSDDTFCHVARGHFLQHRGEHAHCEAAFSMLLLCVKHIRAKT